MLASIVCVTKFRHKLFQKWNADRMAKRSDNRWFCIEKQDIMALF